MKRLCIAMLVLALAEPAAAQTTLGVPNTGRVPPTSRPIQIEDCTTGTVGGLVVAQSNARFKIVFTNESRVQADLIVFHIDYGDEALAIRDVGKFDPGITITHRFRNRGGNVVSSPLFSHTPFHCSINAVHFKDGSVWTPAAAAANAARANISPVRGTGYIGVDMEETAVGVRVRLLTPGGPARTAGLLQGDIIEKIDDQRIATVADAITLISSVQQGVALKVTVVRDGIKRDFNLIVGIRPTTGS